MWTKVIIPFFFLRFFSGHPHFFNQLSCGLDIVSMAGEWLTATANTNMFTYEIAPVFILMEHVVLQKMRELIGWNGGDSILAPGGSISNLYAFLAARHKMFPAYKERGLAAIGGQLVMFTSDQVRLILFITFSISSAINQTLFLYKPIYLRIFFNFYIFDC